MENTQTTISSDDWTTANASDLDHYSCIAVEDPYSLSDYDCDYYSEFPQDQLYAPGTITPQLVLTPIWVLLCTVGNVLNILLLTKMPTSYRITFLTAVALLDMLIMCSYCTSYFIGTAKENVTVIFLNTTILRDTRLTVRTIFRTTSIIAVSCSDWILLVFNVTHLLSICMPLRSLTMCTRTRARMVIAAIALLATATWGFNIVLACLPDSLTYDESQYQWWWDWLLLQREGGVYAFLITYFAILATSVVLVAAIMFRHLSCSRRSLWPLIPALPRSHKPARDTVHRMLLVSASSTTERSRNGEIPLRAHVKIPHTVSAVRMLIITSCVDVLLKGPLVICFLMVQIYCVQLCDRRTKIFSEVAVALYNANYSLHFFIYCLVNREYGKRAWRLVTRRPAYSKAGLSNTLTATSSV